MLFFYILLPWKIAIQENASRKKDAAPYFTHSFNGGDLLLQALVDGDLT